MRAIHVRIFYCSRVSLFPFPSFLFLRAIPIYREPTGGSSLFFFLTGDPHFASRFLSIFIVLLTFDLRFLDRSCMPFGRSCCYWVTRVFFTCPFPSLIVLSRPIFSVGFLGSCVRGSHLRVRRLFLSCFLLHRWLGFLPRSSSHGLLLHLIRFFHPFIVTHSIYFPAAPCMRIEQMVLLAVCEAGRLLRRHLCVRSCRSAMVSTDFLLFVLPLLPMPPPHVTPGLAHVPSPSSSAPRGRHGLDELFPRSAVCCRRPSC